MTGLKTAWFGIAALAAAAIVAPAVSAAAAGQQVNIYSYRKEYLIRPLLDAFSAKTGIEVKLVSAEADALLQRLKSEGMNSPADVLLTADAGRLYRAKAAGVLQPFRSAVLEAAVPAADRDPDGYWYGLSLRARVIFYAGDRVAADELSTYAALVDPKWRGRICVRSSASVYNQSLLASRIAHDGAARAEEWARGMVANLARKPQGGDRDQIRAVAAGECDIAIANTYYYGRMLTSEKSAQRAAANAVTLFWPDQGGRGAHVNVSGAGITKSSKNKDNAVKLLEFLVSDEAQRIYAETVFEYPIKPGVAPSATVASWGTFKADDLNLSALGEFQAEAVRIFDRAGWR